MKGAMFKNTNESVQMSFQYKAHENLTVTSVASTSTEIGTKEVLLSMTVASHVKIGSGDATTSDMVLPAGVWPLLVNPEDTISVIKLTGSVDGMVSIIRVEG